MGIIDYVNPYLEPYEATLETTYLIATTLLAIVMLTVSVVAVLSPSEISNNCGLLLITSSKHKKTDNTDIHTASRSLHGWILLFACREFTIAATILLLHHFGQYQAWSLLVQVSYICGLTDSFAAWKYGVAGAYKMHFFPTMAAGWIGPLGLWLYWR